MPHAVACGDVGPLGDREGASRRYYPVARNHEGSVVERGVLEEQVHDQTAVDGCIYVVACVYDVVKRGCMGYDYEGSGLVLGHSAACLRDFIGCLASGRTFGFPASEELVEDLLSLRALHPLVSDPYQELADFRLEYDDQCYETDVEHGLHDIGHKPHVEGRRQYTDHIEGDYRDEDAHRRCAFYPPESHINDKGQQEDVKYVCQRQVQEAEYLQYHNHTLNHAKIHIIIGRRIIIEGNRVFLLQITVLLIFTRDFHRFVCCFTVI